MKHGLQRFREEGCRCNECLQAMLSFMRSVKAVVDPEAESWSREQIIRYREDK